MMEFRDEDDFDREGAQIPTSGIRTPKPLKLNGLKSFDTAKAS